MFSYESLKQGNGRVQTDIIICVHNALEDVKECLDSVQKFTEPSHSLILINDGSNEETTRFLEGFSKHRSSTLITNSGAMGYTFAANQGLRASKGDFVVLLNSDTVVTPHWLERLIECAESDEKIGIVGPLSNTASWQSIPKLTKNNDWADNPLPDGLTLNEMSSLIFDYSPKFFPTVRFLNGFCLLIKRQLITEIGYFDEQNFGKGYGEEDDYCIRAKQKGWDLVVADNVYIYHKQSRSYTNERRKQLGGHARKKLNELYGEQFMRENSQLSAHHPSLAALRGWFQLVLDRWQLKSYVKKWNGKKVTFIIQEETINEKIREILLEGQTMSQMGIQVNIITLSDSTRNLNDYCLANDFDLEVKNVKSKNVESLLANSDAIIGTSSLTLKWLNDLNLNGLKKAIYIFEFEPLLFPGQSEQYLEVMARYQQNEVILMTKSRVNQALIKRFLGQSSILIPPSFKTPQICAIKQDNPKNSLDITIYTSTYNSLKNTYLTQKMIDTVSKIYEETHDINWLYLHENDSLIDLPSMDIFLDMSIYQPNGLVALEAMSRGAAVIIPKNGIGKEFIKDQRNGRLVDTRSLQECLFVLIKLIEDTGKRQLIQQRAQIDIYSFSPEYAVIEILNHLL
jgi:GT2 family glycosyltransferase